MAIDPITFAIVGAFVAAITGTLLLLFWWQHRETAAPLWWAAGDMTLGAGVLSLAVGNAGDAPPAIGLTLLCVAPALIWTGARSFERLRPRPVLLAAGAAIWLAMTAALLPKGDSGSLGALLSAAIIASCYYALAALTLLRSRQEALPARYPLVGLLALHAVVILVANPAMTLENVPAGIPPVVSLPGIIHFETIVFLIGSALLLVAMTKERLEMRHRSDARTDPLTGLANRRALLGTGERLIARCRQDGTPIVVAAFDLDHFKIVNDSFGHAVGDRTLRVFADVAVAALRPTDLLCRVGGEEFTAIFPGTSLEAGCTMAERIRKAFAQAANTIDGRPVRATVSVGIAGGDKADIPLMDILEQADAALYRAKLNGRDRVECDGERRAFPRLVNVA